MRISWDSYQRAVEVELNDRDAVMRRVYGQGHVLRISVIPITKWVEIVYYSSIHISEVKFPGD